MQALLRRLLCICPRAKNLRAGHAVANRRVWQTRGVDLHLLLLQYCTVAVKRRFCVRPLDRTQALGKRPASSAGASRVALL